MANLTEIMDNETSRKSLFTKFYELERANESRSSQIAELDKNQNKNIHRFILPYDINRVVLQTTNDYINASWLNLKIKDDQVLCFIAAQGPLKETIKDFWWLIWQEQITTIVMLAEEKVSYINDNHYQYWSDNRRNDLLDSISVTQKVIDVHESCVISDISLSNSSCRQLSVKHYQFKGWPDIGIPNKRAFIKFYQLLKTRFDSENTKSPILVHCRAGIGRTGTFILIDIMVRMIENDLNVDPLSLVSMLRNQRMGVIETGEQLQFACKAVLYYCHKKTLRAS